MWRLFKFMFFSLFLGGASAVQAMELGQPEYIGAVYSVSGKGPSTFEQWHTDNCSLKNRNTIVIGAGESELTFNMTWKDNNKYAPASTDWYLDKGKILIRKGSGTYGDFFYAKAKEGERLIIVHIPSIADGSATFEFYLVRPDGGVRHIKIPDMDMLCEHLKTKEQPYIMARFEAKQMTAKGASIIIPGRPNWRKDAKKINLVMSWNDNAQWFDAEIVSE